MEARLWNLGCKIADIEAEAAFYVGLGGRLMLHEKFDTPDGKVEYAIVLFGGTRLFLTPKPIYEDRLEAERQHGLTHAVFEVASLEPEVARLQAGGAEMLTPPTDIGAGFGRRRIAFFRSPGGVIFEVMEIQESAAAVET